METRILLFVLIALAMISVTTEIIQLLLFNTHQSSQEDTQAQKDMDAIVSQTREKSTNILHQAMAQANKMIANAELRGIGIVAKKSLETGKVSHDYEEQIRQMEMSFTQKMEEVTATTESSYQTFLKSLEATITTHMQENQKMLDQKGTQLVDKAESTLTAFMAEMHTKIERQLDRELTRAREEIAEYKSHRIRVIDSHIAELLERTIQIAMGKKLELGNQTDIIYKALQEAKQENALS